MKVAFQQFSARFQDGKGIFAYSKSKPWKQRKFSDLAQLQRGLTYNPSNIRETGVRVLRSSNIREDQFNYDEDDVFVEPSSVNIPYVKNGDIIITSANGSSRLVGKHAIIKDIPENSAVHGGFMLIAKTADSGQSVCARRTKR